MVSHKTLDNKKKNLLIIYLPIPSQLYNNAINRIASSYCQNLPSKCNKQIGFLLETLVDSTKYFI